MFSHLRIFKLAYFVIPASLLAGCLALWLRYRVSSNDELKSLSENLSVYAATLYANADFCGEPVPTDDQEVRQRLAREMQSLARNKGSMAAIVQREARYKSLIMDILRKNHVPEDFYYLAVAESGLSNVSSPRGARGFWQFMPDAARQYGLEISDGVDERYDPVQSTEAACHYLKDSYESFGNWSLVAASFNMGSGGLQRKMDNQRVANYYDLDLSHETSRYVFRVVALKSLLSDPSRIGIRKSQSTGFNDIPSQVIKITESIPDLRSFAETHGTSYEALRMLNPWLTAQYLLVYEGKSYSLRIPQTNELSLQELIDPSGTMSL